MSVFEGGQDPANPAVLNGEPTSAPQDPTTDPNSPPTTIQVGDRTMSMEDIVKKMTHQDTFIETLKEENATLRKSVDDVQDKLVQLSQRPSEPANPAPAQGEQVDPAKVSQIVQEELAARQAADVAAGNIAQVDQELVNRFGSTEAAKQAVQAKAQELGMSVDDIRIAASKSPAAALSWFPAPSGEPAAMQATTNVEALGVANNAASGEQGTYKWWSNLRTTDPKAYFSPKMTKQRLQDADRLGDKFFS